MSDQFLPKISVIIPVFNGTNYLQEAIDTVLSQTYPNYELVVVDDGSTDETWAVIQSYGPRLRGIHKENGGVASALNCGIRQATGKYIAWLSHDDLFLPNKLERQINFLQQFTEFKACYTDYYVIDMHGNVLSEVKAPWYPRVQAIRALFSGMYINGSTMLIERTCFDQVGLFSENLKYTQDGEMWLRILQHFEIGRVPEKLVKQRSHPDQGSRNAGPHRVEAVAMYKQFFEKLDLAEIFPEMTEYANTPRAMAWVYRWLGDTMAMSQRAYTFADEQYRKSITLWPSWRNSARLNLVVGTRRVFFLRRLYYYSVRPRIAKVLNLK